MIVRVNWDPNRVFKIEELIAMFSQTAIRFTFSRPLDEQFSRAFSRTLVQVTFRGQDLVGQMRSIPGQATVKDTDVIWTPILLPPQLREMYSQVSGLVSFDLDCGYVRDADGNPVSGSPSRLLGLRGPYPPSGIFRTWMFKA